ncbi:MAG: hypothetical protein LUI10_06120 [Lachnospiraceae bacterium]|nr:hypothetical protein [Lachnospiraceae bacterium]
MGVQGFIIFIIIAYFAVCMIIWQRNRSQIRAFQDTVRRNHGVRPLRELDETRRKWVSGLWRHFQGPALLDETTWNDLHMDRIFETVNHTYSAAGEEYLYYLLHHADQSEEELLHFESLVQYWEKHPDDRVFLQTNLWQLGYSGGSSVADCIENLDLLRNFQVRRDVFINLLYIPAIILTAVSGQGFLLLLCVMIVQILLYFRKKAEIQPFLSSFAYFAKLIAFVDRLGKLKSAEPDVWEEVDRLFQAEKKLKPMLRGSSWLKDGSLGGGTPVDGIMDYVRMCTHADIIQFYRMLRYAYGNQDELWKLAEGVGRLDASASICAYRHTRQDWCVPAVGDVFSMTNGRYPLIKEPVGNSITGEKPVLLTGSNASGKSTFLRTVAVNAVFAQTIHTCLCDSYTAPLYRIYSSLSLKDDVISGDSYYMVEIKTMKRILDSVQLPGRPVLCVLDEVLRGTNTPERISASSQILRWLSEQNCLCFAATHDLELVDILRTEFAHYHFSESFTDGDVRFPYQLKPGRSESRNAIRLLRLMGYPKEVTNAAEELCLKLLEDKKSDQIRL